jgi:pimeloyl-ACP methyl ester carboxylesterase
MTHGAGFNSELWSNQLDLLGNEINVIAPDLSGHGQSDEKSFDSISGYADWLYEFLENRVGQPIYLVGHSMGGAIALEMAIAHAYLLKGLILVATGARLRVAPQFLEGLLDDFENTVDTIMSYAFSRDSKRELVGQWANIMKRPGPTVVHDDFLACDRFDRRNDIQKITTPCLVICGEHDRLTPLDLSRFLHEQITGSRLKVIARAGHMVMIERYHEVNAAISEFIHEIG